MKKRSSWFFASFPLIITITALTGCAAPKVLQTVPRHVMTNAPAEKPAYEYGHAPSQRVYADSGSAYRAHRRLEQAARLEHERRLKEIEYRSEEAALAAERGVALQQIQPPAQVAVQQASPQSRYSSAPYRFSNWGSGWSGSGWGGGGFGFGGAPYRFVNWGSGASGSFAAGSFGSFGGTAANCQPTGRLFGRTFQQSTPGYRHTGGPAIIERVYSGSAVIQGQGSVNSGLTRNYRLRW